MYTVYHNPRCKKSRAGLARMVEKGLDHEIRAYLTDPLSEEELEKLLMKLNKEPLEMVRTQEDYFRKELKGLNLNRGEWIKVMVEHPKLIKRPIIEGKYKAVLGDPVENIDNM